MKSHLAIYATGDLQVNVSPNRNKGDLFSLLNVLYHCMCIQNSKISRRSFIKETFINKNELVL